MSSMTEFFFKGRLDSMVNVGGIKVYPEEVEAFILKLPFIQEVRVGSKPNPITGNILVAEVVVKPSTGDLQEAIRSHMNALPRAHRPVSFRFVDHLDAGSAGKKIRLPEPLGEG